MIENTHIHEHPVVPRPQRPCHGSGGFSLLEILVALAVLSIIVLLVSMTFKQTSDIWNSSSQRVGLEMAARGIVGRMQEEMSLAVPAANYTNITSKAITHNLKSFPITFIMLKESVPGQREAHQIRYTFSGGEVRRYERPLIFDGTAWALGSESSTVMNDTESGRIVSLDVTIPAGLSQGDDWSLPSRVDIKAEIQYREKHAFFIGLSTGRDKRVDDYDNDKGDDVFVGGTKDD